ncbi:hypothetical protein [Candidatus Uabimicrobium amorphum]|uniref:Uncharacterized protein n=1 Tax=Uabimicrobium amorphum TaxID=2596890 RepID=A0A5S9F3E2_UABAM|nr:hypothetical protein [Candidatus Uabimicrobium amorphum]BBM84398.1 hypothetical protein UABAM_02757 [Candidatus Uabimicrobium amorphum]
MGEFNIIGAVIGAFVGWFIAAMFSSGPKTPIEAFTGDYDSDGLGCLAFLLLIAVGAGLGGFMLPPLFD